MERKNIFKHSEFGDKFKFGNDKVVFVKKIKMSLDDGSEQLYQLVTKHGDGLVVKSDGFAYKCEIEDNKFIDMYVTPYSEDFEEKLDDLVPSRHQVQDYLDDEGYLDENGVFIDYVERAVQLGFEWGYRTKANE